VLLIVVLASDAGRATCPAFGPGRTNRLGTSRRRVNGQVRRSPAAPAAGTGWYHGWAPEACLECARHCEPAARRTTWGEIKRFYRW